MDPDKAISSIASSQRGLFTRAQARRVGFSEAASEWRLQSGRWQIVHRGVYRLPGAQATWEQSVLAVCLLVNGAASHRCAATLLGVSGLGNLVEVTVASRHTVELEGVTMHRSRLLDWADRDRVQGIPSTSVARTVIDLAAVLTRERLEAVLDHVLATRKVPLAYLADRLQALRPGRKGLAVLAGLIAERRGMAHFSDSDPQPELLRAISEAGLPVPASEFPVTLASGRVAYIDAAYPDQALAIEVDSYRHHSSLTDWSRDHARSADLVELGWRVLPITTIQLRDDPAEAARAVARALRTPPAAGVATFPGPDRGN